MESSTTSNFVFLCPKPALFTFTYFTIIDSVFYKTHFHYTTSDIVLRLKSFLLYILSALYITAPTSTEQSDIIK